MRFRLWAQLTAGPVAFQSRQKLWEGSVGFTHRRAFRLLSAGAIVRKGSTAVNPRLVRGMTAVGGERSFARRGSDREGLPTRWCSITGQHEYEVFPLTGQTLVKLVSARRRKM